jgi:hypothetical protein
MRESLKHFSRERVGNAGIPVQLNDTLTRVHDNALFMIDLVSLKLADKSSLADIANNIALDADELMGNSWSP